MDLEQHIKENLSMGDRSDEDRTEGNVEIYKYSGVICDVRSFENPNDVESSVVISLRQPGEPKMFNLLFAYAHDSEFDLIPFQKVLINTPATAVQKVMRWNRLEQAPMFAAELTLNEGDLKGRTYRVGLNYLGF
jgi:hypothetical protein